MRELIPVLFFILVFTISTFIKNSKYYFINKYILIVVGLYFLYMFFKTKENINLLLTIFSFGSAVNYYFRQRKSEKSKMIN